MDKYNKIAIAGVLLLLLAGTAIFGWFLLSKNKSIQIDIKALAPEGDSIGNIQKTEDGEQQAADEPMEASAQNAADSSQSAEQASDIQSSVTSHQDTEKNKQSVEDQKPTASSNLKIINRPVSWGFAKADSRKIDTIIIHSNYNTLSDDAYDIDGAIQQFKTYGVAAHYLIGRDGKIYKLVEERNIAYHAGVSKVPDGRTNANDFSIGIELMTKQSGDAPTDAEYKSLNWLISDIKKRYSIKYVLGHKDIAPGRKTDPWGFDFDKIK